MLYLLQDGLHDSTQREKQMKRFVIAIALACVLSVSALAGDIHTTGAPSPGDVPSTDSPAPGDMPTGDQDDGNQGSGGIALLILDWLF